MSLKDSFNAESSKEIFNHCKSEIIANTAKAADRFKTLITDIRIEKLSKLSRNTKIGIGAGVLGAVVLCTAIFLSSSPDAYQLTIAGKGAGYLQDPEMVPQVMKEIKTDLSKQAQGLEIVVDEKAVACKKTDLNGKKVKFLDDEQLKKLILSANICKASAWAVNINGANVVASATEQEANSILEGVKSHYVSKGSEIVSAAFKENVSVTKAAINAADIMKPEDGVKLILTGTKEPKIYTVQEGDTLWDIAIANGMSPTELQNANPGFDPSKMQIGQQLNLFQVKPFVTVQTKEIVASTEKIDYQTVYENSNTLFKGEVKVKSAGVYGTKQIRTEVTKENGVVIASNQLDSVVTAEAKPQVTLKGTKALTAFKGSGNLSSPLSRIIVSSAFGSRGGGRHTGVDLRQSKGTPIYAADAGVVVSVTNSGTPGKTVKLSHGNGLETWYEHCDTIIVSPGQVIKKGQQIATVGATGNATGYHLHFEVRLNGVPQNPMNYL